MMLRENIARQLHILFSRRVVWQKIEVQVGVLCAGIPEARTDDNKYETISALKKLHAYLLHADDSIKESEIEFLEEEIKRHQNTTQISLYEQKEDTLPQHVIEAYASISHTKEGIVGIPEPYNYRQLRVLTNGVFRLTGDVKFYISRETTLRGKVSGEIYDTPVNVGIATLYVSKKKDPDTDKPLKTFISLFGEKVNPKDFVRMREISLPFRVYRFYSEQGNDYILFTKEKIDGGDYTITGVTTDMDDNKILTETAKLPSKLPFFFAQVARNRIVTYKSHDEFFKRMRELDVSRENTFHYPFSIAKGGRLLITHHPEWFKYLIWAWLTHASIGLINPYPLHLFIVGPKHTGKSVLINCLHARSKEINAVFSGARSTLKSLVPSFAQRPAKIGYLAESSRFAFCDELLRCVFSTPNTGDHAMARDISVSMMNDLLEHQKREFGSGISRVKPNMTARVLAVTNPVRDAATVEDLLKLLDESFSSRFLIYNQQETSRHTRIIRDCKDDASLPEQVWRIDVNDWVSIFDYLQSFTAVVDAERVNAIYDSAVPALSSELHRHYDARHAHHLNCVMDGIVKTRCLFEGDENFTANENDYKIAEMVWSSVISSWIDGRQVRNLPVQKRIHYLPENCQWVFQKITEKNIGMRQHDIFDLVAPIMTMQEARIALVILRDNELIVEINDLLCPYYFAHMFGERKHEENK